MSTITGFGGLDSLSALSSTHSAAPAARPAASWFDSSAGATSASLRAEVEPGARGLSVQQHADRVLAQLVEDSSAPAGALSASR